MAQGSVAAVGVLPPAWAPRTTTTTKEMETQTELRRTRAPWPEVKINIDVKEIEELIGEVTARPFGQALGQVKSAGAGGSDFARTIIGRP